MFGSFDFSLVVMSYAISVFGAYTGLVLAKKVRDPLQDMLWLVSAAVALGGAAIWSMHFIGMLAYKSSIPVSYDAALTMISMLVAVIFTGVGLYLVIRQRRMHLPTLLSAGAIMGSGVAAMHYTGMAAIRVAGEINHDLGIVAVSIAIAIVASTVALWIAFNVRTMWQKVASGFVMGIAVCGMHYTAMLGMTITVDPNQQIAILSQSMIMANELAGYIVVGTMAVLATALLATFAIELSPPRAASR